MEFQQERELAEALQNDENLISDLLDIAKVSSKDEQDARRFLKFILDSAPHTLSAYEKRQRPASINAELEDLEKSLAHLQDTLNALSGATRIYLWTDGKLQKALTDAMGVPGEECANADEAIETTISRLENLKLAALKSARPTPAGSPRQSDKHNIYEMCEIFFNRFSKFKATTSNDGPFRDFVRRVYQEAGGEDSTFKRIGEARRT